MLQLLTTRRSPPHKAAAKSRERMRKSVANLLNRLKKGHQAWSQAKMLTLVTIEEGKKNKTSKCLKSKRSQERLTRADSAFAERRDRVSGDEGVETDTRGTRRAIIQPLMDQPKKFYAKKFSALIAGSWRHQKIFASLLFLTANFIILFYWKGSSETYLINCSFRCRASMESKFMLVDLSHSIPPQSCAGTISAEKSFLCTLLR